MKTVVSVLDVQRNKELLETVWAQGVESPNFKYARGLITRGRCFVPYLSKGEMHFAPSRFVGYKGVTLAKHRSQSAHLDGRLTNPALTSVLNVPLVEDIVIDSVYVSFLRHLGYSGSIHNNKRKYWLTDAALNVISPEQASEMELLVSPETEQATIIQARIGQQKFRQALMKKWQGCPVTGCKTLSVLRASHIKPWSQSSDAERLDPNNGLLLTPNLDVLFDRRLISFDESGTMLCSYLLSTKERKLLIPRKPRIIELTPELEVFMKYHRDNLFLRAEL